MGRLVTSAPPDMVLDTGHGQEVHVFLYPDIDAYHHALTTTWAVDEELAYRSDGFCLGVEATDCGVVAAVLLPRDRVDPALVTHELTHAAFRTLARMDITAVSTQASPDDAGMVSGTEEMLCMLMEELNGGFWRQWPA